MTLQPSYDRFERAGMAACPARAVTPPAQSLAALAAGKGGNITLSLPSAHCAACISTVEATLLAEQGVKAARLNLTQRRVLVKAAPDVQPAQLIAALLRAGYEAFEMDESHLSTTQTQPRFGHASWRGLFCDDECDAAVGCRLVWR